MFLAVYSLCNDSAVPDPARKRTASRLARNAVLRASLASGPFELQGLAKVPIEPISRVPTNR